MELTNQKFGEWTVLYRDSTVSRPARWICQCSCGTIKSVAQRDLVAGKSKKCLGHVKRIQALNIFDNNSNNIVETQNEYINNHRRHDFTNKCIGFHFGKLTVLEKDCVKSDGTYVICKCCCGNTTSVRWSNLISGKIQSCGCTCSRGEERIRNVLQENLINYKAEYWFDDLVGINGGKLRFDFALLNDKNEVVQLIEFQGQQHYDYLANSKFSLNVKEHDSLKKEYCIAQNIPLLCIPYWDLDIIDINYILNHIDKNLLSSIKRK